MMTPTAVTGNALRPSPLDLVPGAPGDTGTVGHVIPGFGGGLDAASTIVLVLAVGALTYLMMPRVAAGLRLRSLPDDSVVGRALLLVAAAAVIFQIVHFAEHALQFGYLVTHPAEAAWLTPWAVATRDALDAGLVGGRGASSAPDEVLHFVGNAAFLAGLVALAAYARLSVPAHARGGRWLRIALWIQGAHIVEHSLLTFTALALGEGVGVSNLFGSVPGGPGAATWYRVTLHFLVNLAASVAAVLALLEVARARSSSVFASGRLSTRPPIGPAPMEP